MRKIVISSLFILFAFLVNGQNLVLNGDFEIGQIPNDQGQIMKADNWTSYLKNTCDREDFAGDLFDKRASDCWITIPYNKWSANRVTIDNKNRYAGISQTEILIGSIKESILPNCTYSLKFNTAVSAQDSSPGTSGGRPCSGTESWSLKPNWKKTGTIEVFLLDGNCQGNKIKIYSNALQSGNRWKTQQINFSIPANSNNYDKVLIQFEDGSYCNTFIDNVSIEKLDNSVCECNITPQSKASAKFVSPNSTIQLNSKYGLVDVAVLCLNDDLLVNGIESSCENGYFVGLSEFDLMNWADVLVLHSDWVSNSSQAPNNIKITDYLPQGYQLRPNKIYKFRLAVGPQWHSVDIWFKIDCCSNLPTLNEGKIEKIDKSKLRKQ